MNLYIQINYPSFGPTQAFDLWWSVHVFQNLGEKEFLKYIQINKEGERPKMYFGIFSNLETKKKQKWKKLGNWGDLPPLWFGNNPYFLKPSLTSSFLCNVFNLVSRLFCNVLIMYKAEKNLEFWGYRGKPFPGCLI